MTCICGLPRTGPWLSEGTIRRLAGVIHVAAEAVLKHIAGVYDHKPSSALWRDTQVDSVLNRVKPIRC
jgi:hypothetical protein